MDYGETPTPYRQPHPDAARARALRADRPGAARARGRRRRARPPARRESFYKRRIAPIGAAILAFLAKIKAILLLLPKVKLLATAGTMAVSIAAYTTIWGFWFAIGFVVLLLVHEMGHVIALRREGIRGPAPDVHPVPGRGDQPRSRWATTRSPRRASASPARSSAPSAPPPASSSGRSPATTSGGRSASPASSSTCSTCCRWCRSTAAARWRRWPRGCGSWASRHGRRWPSSSPTRSSSSSRCSPAMRPTGAGSSAARAAAAAGVLPRQPARPAARRRRLPRPGRAAGRRHGRHAPAPHARLSGAAATASTDPYW